MDIMSKLVAEAEEIPSEEAKIENIVETAVAATAPANGGILLIAACHDWENATSKQAMGLSGPHVIDLGCLVSKCFSSSSSCFSFFVLANGDLYALGNNTHGQLGVGDCITRNFPVKVNTSNLTAPVLKIATGKHHTLCLLSNGDLYGCGSNLFGQLGLGVGTRATQNFLTFTKIDLSNVVDIACGWDHSLVCNTEGHLYTFGHPSYGQLGNGTTGEFIKEGGKGAALQFSFVGVPHLVRTFVVKDSHGRVKDEYSSNAVKVVKVAAGKNHSVCVEDETSGGRVFSWGFGGYGRLGHRSADDELRPREVEFFSPLGYQKHAMSKQVVDLCCGSSFTLAITKTRHLYFFGQMSNSPRGEAQTYPKIQDELYDWSVNSTAAGPNLIVVAADDSCVAWGVPVAGKIGLEANATSSSAPKYVDSVKGLVTSDVSCGYGHVCFIVSAAPGASDASSLASRFPTYPFTVANNPVVTDSTPKGGKRKDSGSTSGKAAPQKKGRK